MKKLKILLPVIAAVTTLSLTACGNQSLGSGNHTYDHCHIQLPGREEVEHYEVKSWRDCDGGWELNLQTSAGVVNVWIADCNVTCFKGNYCPVCGANV